jgi:hypothetical protein
VPTDGNYQNGVPQMLARYVKQTLRRMLKAEVSIDHPEPILAVFVEGPDPDTPIYELNRSVRRRPIPVPFGRQPLGDTLADAAANPAMWAFVDEYCREYPFTHAVAWALTRHVSATSVFPRQYRTQVDAIDLDGDRTSFTRAAADGTVRAAPINPTDPVTQ